MYQTVTFHRLVMFGRALGPWRSERKYAEQDAIHEKLGSYENGTFYVTVPGNIQTISIETRLLQQALAKATPVYDPLPIPQLLRKRREDLSGEQRSRSRAQPPRRAHRP